MNEFIWGALIMGVYLVAAAEIGHLVMRIKEYRVDQNPQHNQTVAPEFTTVESKPRADVVVTGPPMIGKDNLRDWLIHQHRRDNVWGEVVTAFYKKAAADEEILAYFAPTLERDPGLGELQNHFLRALDLVASKGVTEGTLRYLEAKHRKVGVRGAHGEFVPITADIYDRVIGALVEVLQGAGVPQSGIDALAETVAPIRTVLVKAW